MAKSTAKTLLSDWLKLSVCKRLAFTLAEILIVLGILGIIAEMTIPTLMHSVQKQQMIVGLKKAYSNLSQVVATSINENGDINTWNWSLTQTPFVKEYFLPYFSIIKDCGTLDTASCGGKTKKWLNGSTFNCTESGCGAYKVIMADGTSWAFDYRGVGTGMLDIVVDLNGSKNPNVAGKDVFFFRIYYSHSAPDFMDIWATTRDVAISNTLFGCNKTAKEAGLVCGKLILLDGWQMKEDYPW